MVTGTDKACVKLTQMVNHKDTRFFFDVWCFVKVYGLLDIQERPNFGNFFNAIQPIYYCLQKNAKVADICELFELAIIADAIRDPSTCRTNLGHTVYFAVVTLQQCKQFTL